MRTDLEIPDSANVTVVPSYANACGILALILSIIGFLVPVIGVLVITPVAIAFGIAALHGRALGMGVATLVIVVVNLVVSPAFWVNVAAGSMFAPYRALTALDVTGVAIMLYLAAKSRRGHART